jgi:DNA-directed RNA polymerase sigma subunit (sigma70/sigma32)
VDWHGDPEVAHLLGRLSDERRRVIAYRFGLDRETPRALDEVAALIGRTRSDVEAIMEAAMAALREGT